MTEPEAVQHLQDIISDFMTVPHTQGMFISGDDRDLAWVHWTCWQVRVGLGYHMPELASIRVLRVYKLFHLFVARGGADFDVQVGYSGRSERVKVIVEGIGMNTCRITLYRWVNGQRRRIAGGVVGVLAGNPGEGHYVENLQTMPAAGR